MALRLKGEGGGEVLVDFFSHYITVNKKNIENYSQQFISKKKRILGIFRHQKGMKQNHFCKTVEIAYRMVLSPHICNLGKN